MPRPGDPDRNVLGQPTGPSIPDWKPPPVPPTAPMDGRSCRLEPLDASAHATELFAANAHDPDGRNWTYLPYGPFATVHEYSRWVEAVSDRPDPQFHAVIMKSTGKPAGVASYLRITPTGGSIEIGHIHFSELMKRSPAATEALFLMMERAFDLGYRRCEWKCDALNAVSCAAARRLGFSFEGVFRQATVYKGRNRDTAWFAVVDTDWPALRTAFTRWLDPENFDSDGRQRRSLREFTAPSLRNPAAP